MNDYLGVTFGVEDVAQGLQFRNQLLVVVDFSVKDHYDRAVFVEQRLLAGGNVDDGQAPMAQTYAGFDMQAALVRTAMQLRVVHTLEYGAVDVACAAGVKNSGNAAHVVQGVG